MDSLTVSYEQCGTGSEKDMEEVGNNEYRRIIREKIEKTFQGDSGSAMNEFTKIIRCMDIDSDLVASYKLMKNLDEKNIDKVSSRKAQKVKTLEHCCFPENNITNKKVGTSER